jgi:hypothetical protein
VNDATCSKAMIEMTSGNCSGAKDEKAQACFYNFIIKYQNDSNTAL